MRADRALRNFHVHCLHRSRGSAGFGLVAAKSASLESNEMRCLARERYIGGKLALEHLAREQQLAAFFAEADGIADKRASQRGSELRSEVAHLVGVRHQHQ